MQNLGLKGEDQTLQLSTLCARKLLLEAKIRLAEGQQRYQLQRELEGLRKKIGRLTEKLRCTVE